MNKKTFENPAIIAAIIAAIAACSVPVVTRLLDIFVPVPQASSSPPATQIITATLTASTPSSLAPSASPSQISDIDTFCPPSMGYGYSLEDGYFKPGMVIIGPATLHPFEGSPQLGQALGFADTPRWGINIPQGTTIVIPNSVDIFGKPYAPEGLYETYTNDDIILKVQNRWLTYCD